MSHQWRDEVDRPKPCRFRVWYRFRSAIFIFFTVIIFQYKNEKLGYKPMLTSGNINCHFVNILCWKKCCESLDRGILFDVGYPGLNSVTDWFHHSIQARDFFQLAEPVFFFTSRKIIVWLEGIFNKVPRSLTIIQRVVKSVQLAL